MRKSNEIIPWMIKQIWPFILSFALIILLEAVLSLCGVSIAILSKNFIDMATQGQRDKVIWNIIVFVMLILINIGCQSFLTPLTARTQEKISNNIRRRIFANLMKSDWKDFSKYHSEDILTRLTRDIGIMVNVFMNAIPDIVSLIVKFVAAFITLYYYEPLLALTAFTLSPAALIFSHILGHRIKKFHKKMQETEGTYRALINESIQNLLIIKSFGLEDKNVESLEGIQREMVGLASKKGRMNSRTNAVLNLGYWAGYFLAMGLGVMRFSEGKASFGTLIAFVQLVGQVQGPFISLAYSYPKLLSAWASAERLIDIEKMKTENLEGTSPLWSAAGIKFSNVSFSYNNEKDVLKNVSFEIKEGELAAIVGPSGDGKTTIVRLILSFIKPKSGRVCFTSSFGEELSADSPTRCLASYVPQGNTLFSGTIAENLRFGNPEATVEDMKKALHGACALEFVEMLPYGVDTVIGERGLGLSEGQAQRLAIARALLRNAPILILDEATSALDIETEKNVLKTIAGLDYSPTCLLITHRTTALKICNKIFKLNKGQLWEYSHGAMEAAASQKV